MKAIKKCARCPKVGRFVEDMCARCKQRDKEKQMHKSQDPYSHGVYKGK